MPAPAGLSQGGCMDLGLFVIYATVFVLGMWYAFRSGMLAERAKWQDKTRVEADYRD